MERKLSNNESSRGIHIILLIKRLNMWKIVLQVICFCIPYKRIPTYILQLLIGIAFFSRDLNLGKVKFKCKSISCLWLLTLHVWIRLPSDYVTLCLLPIISDLSMSVSFVFSYFPLPLFDCMPSRDRPTVYNHIFLTHLD